ncbi:putative enzyme [Candidatus Desulfarcum epimagneticum]|uniref:Putative enzyme n=1 Tax=uncultured Desulfobacteraceae bacterium TaxID=218296 RepID=A0A484HJB1_9BACT|nr:putative enzyme [uncultured Desulfobacteraceae bacterium]
MQNETKSVIIGSDHAAYELKNKIRDFLEKKGFEVTDAGTDGPESSDYPDFGARVARGVSEKKFEKGVLLCGTGIGMSMVANRFAHVRAALCRGLFDAVMSRRHNDANILVLGGRVTGDVLAFEIVDAWLKTPFEGGRHQRRLDQFDDISLDDIAGRK